MWTPHHPPLSPDVTPLFADADADAFGVLVDDLIELAAEFDYDFVPGSMHWASYLPRRLAGAHPPAERQYPAWLPPF